MSDGIYQGWEMSEESDDRTQAISNQNKTIEATPVDPPCERCGQARSRHEDQDSCNLSGEIWLCPVMEFQTFRRRVTDMPRAGLAPHPDVPLGQYVHTKSARIYLVTGGVFLATGDEDTVLVVYESALDGYQAVRTVADFLAEVQVDGKQVRRFQYLGT
jgi:hypothetical protein